MIEPEEHTGWPMHTGFAGDVDATTCTTSGADTRWLMNARRLCGQRGCHSQQCHSVWQRRSRSGHGYHQHLALWVGCLTKVAGPWLAALILIGALATNPGDVG
jgi:hypothetical protein